MFYILGFVYYYFKKLNVRETHAHVQPLQNSSAVEKVLHNYTTVTTTAPLFSSFKLQI